MTQQRVTDGFPLQWPNGFPRTKRHERGDGANLGRMTPGRILDLLEDEVRRLGGRDVIVSTNMRVRLDGRPYANSSKPDDPGAAVYFLWHGKQHAMACDRYTDVWRNLRAITLCIESLRRLERHGGGAILERAFTGFQALPASIVPRRPWWVVLGWDDRPAWNGQAEAEILAAFRRCALTAHPDKGGSGAAMDEVARARDEGLRWARGGRS